MKLKDKVALITGGGRGISDESKNVTGKTPSSASRLRKKCFSCFESLSMNGKSRMISRAAPFAPSSGSGQALSSSKGERSVFPQPASGRSKSETFKPTFS
ncbi:MAG: hypothetical protein UY82_C0062G0008 [Candidatus Uhrbacteria bacterium GW2011_GWC2_53_7]|uniref:Uncharacterized protein n=1 Tax=Candidatus Uhrbacteria bacterium GW2011_GWC2_53_7 TaxID=1618986 RepID=A0A0G1XU49_9BACT|nr:MAG: hypothetical protein UY82_C0062G0008 [Candidatus Uhrbacteria bacterium GW2011_GWC2_53_7]